MKWGVLMAKFTANTRVPTRPLSYENRNMAYNKELMIDYKTGLIYVVDENGNIIDVSKPVYEKLLADGNIKDGIVVEIPNPDNPDETIIVTIQESITAIISRIEVVESNIETIRKKLDSITFDDSGNIQIDIDDIETSTGRQFVTQEQLTALNKLISFFISNGSVVVKASSVTQDATHRFVTDTQIANMGKKATVTDVIVSIALANIGTHTDNDIPYKCTVNCTGLDPSYPAPILDISYTDNVFENNEKEEDSFYCISRCTITEKNKANIYFREMPTTAFKVRFQIYTPGI